MKAFDTMSSPMVLIDFKAENLRKYPYFHQMRVALTDKFRIFFL